MKKKLYVPFTSGSIIASLGGFPITGELSLMSNTVMITVVVDVPLLTLPEVS